MLRAWIDQGAAWPDSASAEAKDPRDWWSLKPLVQPAVPERGERQIRSTLSSARSSQRKARPVARSRRRARFAAGLYFDLTGLPPTPEEMEAFVDESMGE